MSSDHADILDALNTYTPAWATAPTTVGPGINREVLERAREVMRNMQPYQQDYFSSYAESQRYIKLAVPTFHSRRNETRRSYEFEVSIEDETIAYEIEERIMREMRRDAERRFHEDPDLRGYHPSALKHEREIKVNEEILLMILRMIVRKRENEQQKNVTRKDYTLIAEGIAKSALRSLDKQVVAEDLGKVLLAENPNFDLQKFITAATHEHSNHTSGTPSIDVGFDPAARI
jgi:hypothetical protein